MGSGAFSIRAAAIDSFTQIVKSNLQKWPEKLKNYYFIIPIERCFRTTNFSDLFEQQSWAELDQELLRPDKNEKKKKLANYYVIVY